MIPTYGGVLSAIKKALQELMEEYQGVGKSLSNLVESQECYKTKVWTDLD